MSWSARALSAFCALIAWNAAALSQRTFVASTGSDSNPCSRTSPCRSFQAAIAAVMPGGEVVALDSAGYGPFSVDKSVTVTAEAVHAAITIATPSGNGVLISGTTATDRVVLRNLTINGVPGGGAGAGTGINADAVPIAALYVDNCVLSGLNAGIHFVATTNAEVHVTNTAIRDIGDGFGIVARGQGSVLVQATVDRCALETINSAGLFMSTHAEGVVTRSTGSGVTVSGAFVAAKGGILDVDHCVASGNVDGVSAVSTGDILRVSNSIIANNTKGINVAGAGAQIVSVGGNQIVNNLANDAFTSTVASQ